VELESQVLLRLDLELLELVLVLLEFQLLVAVMVVEELSEELVDQVVVVERDVMLEVLETLRL
tara:strand:+ start:27 stop:215 length:189 start_codon:yes stop_codon:yes gene_type:complete